MLCFGVTKYCASLQRSGRRICTWLTRPIQIEYLVVTLDNEQRKVQLSLRQADILEALACDEELRKQGGCVPDLQEVAQYGFG